jgi:hypothetical protein
MDLLRHIRILWRHRLALAVGILVGSALAVLVGYNVQPGKSPVITPRGEETWMSVSRLLVTQEGFPEGRVTLPAAATDPKQRAANDGLQFADPARFQGLASLYAVLANSDQVRSRLAQRPERDQITALVVDPDGPGSLSSLPVIELSTLASSAAAARKLNVDTVAALRGVLSEQQNDNKIDSASRVRLDSLDFPSAPILVTGRSHMASLVVFMIALLSAIGFAQLIEAVGSRRGGSKPRSGASGPQRVQPLEPAFTDRSPSDWKSPERPPPLSDEVTRVSKLPRG